MPDGPRTRHEPGRDSVSLSAAFNDRGEGTEVLNPAVGAGSEKHIIDLVPKKPFSGGEAHIVQRTLSRVRRDGTVNRHTHTRIRSVSDHRADVRGVEHIFLVKDSIFSAA